MTDRLKKEVPQGDSVLLEQWKAQVQADENGIVYPIVEGTPQNNDFSKMLALKSVVSVLERSARGDFSRARALEIINDLSTAASENAAAWPSSGEEAAVAVYQECLRALQHR